MVLDKTINTVVGGLVAVKVLETAGNMFDKPSTKRKKKKGSKKGRSRSTQGFGTGLNLL